MVRTAAVTVAVVMLVTSGLVAASELDLLPLGDQGPAFEVAAVPAGAVYDVASGELLDMAALANRLATARVVLLGEEHTAMDQKLFHADLLAALAARRSNVVLGLEFFDRSHDEVLARWSRGEIDEDELLAATEWYERGSYRFEYYRPVMEVAREHGLRVVGLNVPRAIPRAVNRGGLDSLDDEQRALVGEVDTGGSVQHRYLVSRYFGNTVALLPPGWFDNMYAAQCLWDVVMARSILAALPADGVVVAVAGSGHVAYGLGIPRRIASERAAAGAAPLDVVTFCPVTAPPPGPDGGPHGHPMGGDQEMATPATPARFVRSLADLVGGFVDHGGIEAFPSLGVRLSDDDGPVVSLTFPDTPAAAAGLVHGDRIVDVNGWAPPDLAALRRRLAQIEWGDRIDLRIARDGVRLDIAMLLYPEIAPTEQLIAPDFEVVAAAAYDPGAAVPAAAAEEVADATAALVRQDGRPLRIEVRTGDRLEAVHELDDTGRASRSLYREPLPDGTVEVRYERDTSGAVAASTRRDRTGAPVPAE